MTQPFDLLVAGEINPDLILSGDVEPVFGQVEKLVDRADLTIGSSSVIMACGAARLGLRVIFAGLCGDDLFGRYMLDAMHEYGIDTSPVECKPGETTGLSVILNRGTDRAILTLPGQMPYLAAAHLSDELLSRARHLHIASYFLQTVLQPDLPDVFRRAHAQGLTTSLDTNWDPSGEWRGFDELLAQVDVFLPNENEALALTRQDKVEDALEHLARRCPTVAVKLGARGGIAHRDGETAVTGAIKVDVMDTVGAGDTFDSGFLYGYLHGWPLEKSLKLAVACGSLSTRAIGGTAGQPTLEEAMIYVGK
jgi:sugar/nucleoside kinase (ribokinase family)